MPRAFSDMAGGIDSKSSDVENLTWWLLVYIVSPQRLPLFLMFKVLQHPIQMERIRHDFKTSGHLGQQKTLERLKQNYMWYNMACDFIEYVKSCSTYNQNKKPHVRLRASLGTYHSGFPMERVHLDILGPFNTSEDGNSYVLMMIDQFTKWIEIAALPDQCALSIAQKFLVHFIVTFGCPLQFHTD